LQQKPAYAFCTRIRIDGDRIEPRHRRTVPEKDHRIADDLAIDFRNDRFSGGTRDQGAEGASGNAVCFKAALFDAQ
jgi:hypothetical protein